MKAAYTVITSNYVSYAKTLGDSLIKYNPGYSFFVCLIDFKPDLLSQVDLGCLKVIRIEELADQPVIIAMQERYTLFELSCALKPYFADYILGNSDGVERLKYFDSDIMFFNSFDNEWEQRDGSIFLTPHFFKSVSLFDSNINDSALLKLGIYNAGYFEVVNNITGNQFLQWWKSYLADYCFDRKSPYEHIYVDQSWLDLVPLYFKETYLIDHLGYNTSFYNLHERRISMRGKDFYINTSQKLVFFHFTGYLYYKHEIGSRNHPRHQYHNTEFLKEICEQYRITLLKNSIDVTFPPPQINKTKEKIAATKVALISSANSILIRLFRLKITKANNNS